MINNRIKTSNEIQVANSEQDLLKVYNLPVEDNICFDSVNG